MAPRQVRERLEVEHAVRWSELTGRRTRVTWSVGPRGELVALSLPGQVDYWTEDEDGTMRPKLRAGQDNRYQVHVLTGRGAKVRTIDVETTRENYHYVQLLDDDELLLVRGRIDEDERDKNAAIFDAKGARVGAFRTGDAVQDVQAMSRDRIWVSYFDENGQMGLECTNLRGDTNFVLDELEDEPVMECFALNATPTSVLAYTAPGFPLVEIDSELLSPSLVLEQSPVEGARAVAASGDLLVFASSFELTDSLFVCTRDAPQKVRRIALHDARGESFEIIEAAARGARLWLADRDGVVVIDAEALRSPVGVDEGERPAPIGASRPAPRFEPEPRGRRG
ncbi:hypothetical protein L6R52_38650, partial [Myxococcota bacterium]|nr:hypothetical protein [Myxococcota bacterium]